MPAPEGYKKLAAGVLCRCPKLHREFGDAYCCQGEWGPPIVPRPMPLEEALSRLAAVHTRDDHKTGYHVIVGATPDAFMMEQGEYVRAWEAVRRHLGLQIDPQE